MYIASTNVMLKKILLDLKQMGGITASSIASRDGLVVVSDMESESHAETFAAMSATMLGAAESATTELGKGIPDRVIVESDHGKLIAMGAGPKALIVILTEPDAGLGLILVELEKSVNKITKIM
ncbi:MAG TPA: roadblock/LC7 domain-containing protein [Methanosarcinaceae archaeon]|nr:roadblock/LC7 domain-containing protein [Methanosarcinaceae archaeon]